MFVDSSNDLYYYQGLKEENYFVIVSMLKCDLKFCISLKWRVFFDLKPKNSSQNVSLC